VQLLASSSSRRREDQIAGGKMTSPKVETLKRGGSRFYVNPETKEKAIGVTSVTGMLPKPFLRFWATKLAAEWAVENVGTITNLITSNEKSAAVDLIKKAPDRYTKQAADRGTAIHDLVEKANQGDDLGVVHPDFRPDVDRYHEFLSQFNPEFLEVESTVWSDEHGYAGTLDGICRIDGETLIYDLKTGKSVYSEVALQLAAYKNADYIINADGTQRDIPDIQGAFVVHLRPEGFRVVPVRIDDDVFEVFKSLLQIVKWDTSIQKTVLGADLEQ
jgi:hypothetical protein